VEGEDVQENRQEMKERRGPATLPGRRRGRSKRGKERRGRVNESGRVSQGQTPMRVGIAVPPVDIGGKGVVKVGPQAVRNTGGKKKENNKGD